MAMDWQSLLGLMLIGAGGGNPVAVAAQKNQQKRLDQEEADRKAFGQSLQDSLTYDIPTVNVSPTMKPGETRTPQTLNYGVPAGSEMSPMALAGLMASAPKGYDPSPIMTALSMQERNRTNAADLEERRRQFDIEQVMAAERDVSAATERSLARGERRNEDINQRNFQREQYEASRQNAMDIANIRAESQLGSASNVQSVQPLGDGTLVKIYRNGNVERVDMDGKPLMGARNDPSAIYDQAAARSGGAAAGKQAEAAPQLDANFQTIMSSLDALEGPDMRAQAGRALGYSSYLPTIPGYNAEFRSRTGQLQGQAFLQAYNALRGGGAITEVEGAKGEASIARLQAAQTPEEFYEALKEARMTFGTIYAAAKERANRGAVVPQMRGNTQQQPQPQSNDGWTTLPSGARVRLKQQ